MSDERFFAMAHDAANSSTLIRILHDRLIAQISNEAVLRIIADEIEKALTTDAELRILVRECVKEAIARMDLQEVVTEAVKAALKTTERPAIVGGDWMQGLTWRCDICHRERPDAAISVHKVDIHPEKPGIVIRNVKFCNDNPACKRGAENWKERR